MAKNTLYRRIPGRGSPHAAGYSTAWIGPDHLLIVETTAGEESYKRFYYREIESIVVRRTAAGLLFTIVFLVLTLLASLSFAMEDQLELRVFWGICISTCGLIFLVNLIGGTTCETVIRTAVQTEKLPWRRLRPARKALARIRPFIEQVQGVLAPEQFSPELPAKAERAGSRNLLAVRSYQSHAHAWLFSVLLAESIRTGFDFIYESELLTLLEVAFSATAMILTIIALTRQSGTSLHAPVQKTTWLAAGFLALCYLLGVIQYVAISVQSNKQVLTQWDILETYSRTSPFDSQLLFISFCVTGMGSLIVGALGWLTLRQFYQMRSNHTASLSPLTPPESRPSPVDESR